LAADHQANSLAASRKSPLLVAETNVGTAEVWDATTQKRTGELRSSPDYSVYAVAISANDKLVAACGTNGTVVVFDHELSKPVSTLGDKADTRMASLSFAPDGKMLAAMDRYGHLVLWKLSNRTQLAEWQGIGGEDCSIHWSTDGKQLAVSGWGKVTLIAAEKGSQPRVVEAPEAVLSRHPKDDSLPRSGPEPGGIKFASVTAIAPDLRTTASVAPDASIGIWDLATRKVVQTLPAPAKVAIMDSQIAGLRNLTFSPNGQRLACTTLRGEVIFWQVAQAAVGERD
jgi:WD40 repeat protein